ncbi:MAG: hypothetical protein ACI9NN_001071, partial [Bacteroidia bacterium]
SARCTAPITLPISVKIPLYLERIQQLFAVE